MRILLESNVLLRLAAAMLRHSLTHILTFNAKDFRPYQHITTLEPRDVVSIF